MLEITISSHKNVFSLRDANRANGRSRTESSGQMHACMVSPQILHSPRCTCYESKERRPLPATPWATLPPQHTCIPTPRLEVRPLKLKLFGDMDKKEFVYGDDSFWICFRVLWTHYPWCGRSKEAEMLDKLVSKPNNASHKSCKTGRLSVYANGAKEILNSFKSILKTAEGWLY